MEFFFILYYNLCSLICMRSIIDFTGNTNSTSDISSTHFYVFFYVWTSTDTHIRVFTSLFCFKQPIFLIKSKNQNERHNKEKNMKRNPSVDKIKVWLWKLRFMKLKYLSHTWSSDFKQNLHFHVILTNNVMFVENELILVIFVDRYWNASAPVKVINVTWYVVQ